MRLLFFGAGALGTLFAARMCAAGHDVSVLARGERLVTLRRDGLRIRARARGEQATESLRPEAVSVVRSEVPYDLVIVLVRRTQVDDALRAVAAEHDGDVLVMVNEARGYEAWRAILGERLFVGFGGAIASFDESGVLVYEIAPALLQPTVIGEPDGRVTERVSRAANALRGAGFPVQVRRDMEAWQRTHAAWITPFMLVSTAAARDAETLNAADRARTWVGATREALAAVRAAGTPLVPLSFRLLAVLPAALTASLLGLALRTRSLRARVVTAGAASTDEGPALVADLAALAGRRLPGLEALAAQASTHPVVTG
jgi:2-dehydropantoate 2-reductase